MKLPHVPNQLAPEDDLNADNPAVVVDLAVHPTRRLADITPASRVFLESETPPTSPKIHEIRERQGVH